MTSLIASLRKHELDFVFCTAVNNFPELTFEEYTEHKLYLCVYPSHKYASLPYVTIDMLEGQDVVRHTTGTYLHNSYIKLLEEAHVQVNTAAEADEDKQVAALVEKKLGITIISTNDPSQFHGVVMVPLKHDRYRRVISIGSYRNDLSVQLFIRVILENKPS